MSNSHCININHPEYKQLLKESGIHPVLLSARVMLWQQNNSLDEFPNLNEITNSKEVNFILKSVYILQSDKAKQIFEKGKKAGWDLNKILTELQIPKEQKQLILDLNITDREQLALELASKYSYSVEINTAKAEPFVDKSKINTYVYNNNEYIDAGFGYYKNNTIEITEQEYNEAVKNGKRKFKEKPIQNTAYYSSLTVAGGTNYTEQEISTPLITPSIKGHAQFATANGIGWFRSDDRITQRGSFIYTKEQADKDLANGKITEFDYEMASYSFDKESATETDTKTRRILEVQSDLFQKGRDKDDLIAVEQFENENDVSYENIETGEIITGEDLFYGGYNEKEKSKFKIKPFNNKQNNSKNQFFQLLNKDNNWVTFFVKSIIQDSAKKGYEKVLFPRLDTIIQIESENKFKTYTEAETYYKHDSWKSKDEELRKTLKEYQQEFEDRKSIKKDTKEIEQVIINQKERIRSHQPTLLNTATFYENDVTNILNKIYGKENVKLITDEFGNTWNEIIIKKEDLKPILLQSKSLSKKQKNFFKFKKVFNQYGVEVIEDSNLNNNGIPIVAQFDNGKIFINPSLVKEDTLLHELAHPFIELIEQQNPILYKALTEKAILEEYNGQNVLDFVKEEYPYLSEKDQIKEAVVTILGLQKTIKNKSLLNAIKVFLEKYIKPLLRQLLNKEIDISKIDFNSSFKDLQFILEGNKFNFSNITGQFNQNFSSKKEENRIFNFPFKPEVINNIKSSTKRLTVRKNNFKSGIYSYNGIKFRLTNMGLEDLSKDTNGVKKKFITEKGNYEDYKNNRKKDKFGNDVLWFDNFMDGKEAAFVYLISNINDDIKNELNVFNAQEVIDSTEEDPIIINDKKSDSLNEYKFEKVETSTYSFKKNYEKLKDKLRTQYYIYKKSNKSSFAKEIKEMYDLFNNDDTEKELMNLNLYVETAVKWIKIATEKINIIDAKIAEGYEESDHSVIIEELEKIEQFTSAYNILDEFSITSVNDEFTNEALANLLKSKNLILQRQLALTKLVLQKEIIRYNKNPDVTEEFIGEELTMIENDISATSSLFGAAITSGDSITSLYTLKLKNLLETVRMNLLSYKKDIMDTYNKTKGNKNNVKQFNSKYLRDVFTYKKDSNGNLVTVKTKGFIQKYNNDLFDKNQSDMFERVNSLKIEQSQLDDIENLVISDEEKKEMIDLLYEKLEIKKSKIIYSFYEINLKSVSIDENINNFIELTKGMSRKDKSSFLENNSKVYTYETEEEYKNAYASLNGSIIENDINDLTIRVTRKSLSSLSDKYLNKEYESIKNDSLYVKYMNYYNMSNNILPESERLKFGIIPQKEKNTKDRIIERSFSLFGISYKTNNQDIEKYGYQNTNGETFKKIPISYTYILDEKDLSYDLLESILEFTKMANIYKFQKELQPEVNLLKQVISERTVKDKDKKTGKPFINNISKGKEYSVASNKQFIDQLNQIIYKETADTLEFLGINVNKVAGSLSLITSVAKLAGNVISAATNSSLGNMNNLIHSAGKEFYSPADYGLAVIEYFYNLPKMLAEVGTDVPKTKINILANYFDAIQGKYLDSFGENVSGSNVKKLFSTSTLFCLNHAGEHQIQLSSMIAYLKSKNKNGVSYWNLLNINNGEVSTILTKEEIQEAKNEIHGINRQNHGNYASFDKNYLARQWWGSLFLSFRKHVYDPSRARWKFTKTYDAVSGKDIEGFYITTFKSLLREIEEHKLSIFSKSKFTKQESIAIRKTVADLGIMCISFGLYIIAKADYEDDEDKKLYKAHILLQITRLNSDLTFFINPQPVMRTFSNPMVALGQLNEYTNFIKQMIKDPFGEYKKDYGIHEKGDSKLKAKFDKLIPLYKQYLNMLNPEDQIKFLDR